MPTVAGARTQRGPAAQGAAIKLAPPEVVKIANLETVIVPLGALEVVG
jgi:hypothetical protein